jgi:hypothetical protein
MWQLLILTMGGLSPVVGAVDKNGASQNGKVPHPFN